MRFVSSSLKQRESARTVLSSEERFWSRVDKTDTCWLWTGPTQRGYGITKWRGQSLRAHQVAYLIAVGPVPAGLELDHLCGRPRCVNPSHLEPVTHAENIARGRRGKGKTLACKRGHPYDEANTVHRAGTIFCRTCEKERGRSRYRSEPWRYWRETNRQKRIWMTGGDKGAGGCCEAPGCHQPARHTHHVFGRGVHVAEPLASCWVFLKRLCADHHAAVHGLVAAAPLDLWAMRSALDEASAHFGVSLNETAHIDRGALVGTARQLEASLRASERWDELHQRATLRAKP